MDCTALDSIDLPETLNSVDDQAFSGCSALYGISFPDGVTSIGVQAFEDCTKMMSAEIPGSVTHVGKWAFINCPALAILSQTHYEPDGWDPDWNPDKRSVGWNWGSFKLY